MRVPAGATGSGEGVREVVFSFHPTDEGRIDLSVTIGPAEQEAPGTSFARLMRWLRERLAPSGRHERVMEARASRLLFGEHEVRATRLGDTGLFELTLNALPEADVLDRWAHMGATFRWEHVMSDPDDEEEP